MKPYRIQLEISGPTALWARPDIFDEVQTLPPHLLQAGNAGYIGGINGPGINLNDLNQATRDLLEGGL